jgi:hypothetical protein
METWERENQTKGEKSKQSKVKNDKKGERETEGERKVHGEVEIERGREKDTEKEGRQRKNTRRKRNSEGEKGTKIRNRVWNKRRYRESRGMGREVKLHPIQPISGIMPDNESVSINPTW